MPDAQLFLGLAVHGDAPAIFGLVYEHPDPFVRAATLAELEGWIGDGVCWILREIRTGRIVGACIIKVPEASPDAAPPAEFGGLYLHSEYRLRGVADALGLLAISSYFWDNDPDSNSPIPLIAHVHVENQAPRGVLERAGFVFDRKIDVPPGVPGFAHMPRDANGIVWGDEFYLPPGTRVALFRRMAELLSGGRIGDLVVEIEPALAMSPEELLRLASQLEQ